jgi:hypothetical protein
VEMKAWIVTAAGGYNLVDTGKYTVSTCSPEPVISL